MREFSDAYQRGLHTAAPKEIGQRFLQTDNGSLWKISAVSAAGVPTWVRADKEKAYIPVGMGDGWTLDATGAPLAVFSDGVSSTPGIDVVDGKTHGVRWNNDGTPTPIVINVPLPDDLDDSEDIILHFSVSKSGATLADAATLTVLAYFQSDAALHDADADAGGVTNALVGDATAKTVDELTLTIAAADIPSGTTRSLHLSVQPTDGTIDTDDLIIHKTELEYTRIPEKA